MRIQKYNIGGMRRSNFVLITLLLHFLQQVLSPLFDISMQIVKQALAASDGHVVSKVALLSGCWALALASNVFCHC